MVADRVAVDHLAFVVGLLPQRSPGDLALGQQRAEGRVFAAGPRQHGDETALALMEIGHVLAAGQLAVGHVQEVAAAGQLAEQVPGVAMRLVVGHVAACGAEVQRHAAVGRDREDEQQLLQIGTMVLVVSEGDGQGGTAEGPLLAIGVGVGSAESDGGRIVVQFVQGDAELLDDVRCHGEDQRGHVGHKQPIQRSAHAVVVEPFDLLGGQPQRIGGVACGPFAHAIDRLPRDQEVPQQNQEGLDRREFRAAVFGRQGGGEKIPQPHAPQELVEDRQGADGVGTQCAAWGTCDVRGESRRCRALAGKFVSFCHKTLRLGLGVASRAAARPRALREQTSRLQGNVHQGKLSSGQIADARWTRLWRTHPLGWKKEDGLRRGTQALAHGRFWHLFKLVQSSRTAFGQVARGRHTEQFGTTRNRRLAMPRWTLAQTRHRTKIYCSSRDVLRAARPSRTDRRPVGAVPTLYAFNTRPQPTETPRNHRSDLRKVGFIKVSECCLTEMYASKMYGSYS